MRHLDLGAYFGHKCTFYVRIMCKSSPISPEYTWHRPLFKHMNEKSRPELIELSIQKAANAKKHKNS